MNTFASTLYRDFTCGAAAVLITLILSAAFVQSTSVPRACMRRRMCLSHCSPSTPGSASPSRPFW